MGKENKIILLLGISVILFLFLACFLQNSTEEKPKIPQVQIDSTALFHVDPQKQLIQDLYKEEISLLFQGILAFYGNRIQIRLLVFGFLAGIIIYAIKSSPRIRPVYLFIFALIILFTAYSFDGYYKYLSNRAESRITAVVNTLKLTENMSAIEIRQLKPFPDLTTSDPWGKLGSLCPCFDTERAIIYFIALGLLIVAVCLRDKAVGKAENK